MPARNKFTVILSSYVIFRRGDEVLLLRRHNTGYQDGNYGLPSGHIEEGEFALTGAIREAHEEVGIKLPADQSKNDPRHASPLS